MNGQLLNQQIWWDMSRASANVSWVLIVASMMWGVLLSTRVLRSVDSPGWLRDLHSWLGGLSLMFAGIHMATLIADSYVRFTLIDVTVPFASEWKPIPVALGVATFWLLVAVQGTSLMMKKMSRNTWRRVHMLSYLLFATSVVHALGAGTDVGSRIFTWFSVGVAMTGTSVACLRWVAGRAADRRHRRVVGQVGIEPTTKGL